MNSWTKTDANEEMAVVLALRFLSLRTDGDLLIIFGNPNVFNSKYRLHVKAKRGSEKKVKTSGEHTNSETYFENAIQYATAHQGAHSIYWTHKIKTASIGDTQLLKERIIPENQIAPILFGFDMMGQCSLKSMIPISVHFEDSNNSVRRGLIGSRNLDHRETQEGKVLSYNFLLSLDSDGNIEKHGTRILEHPLLSSKTNSLVRGGGTYQRYMLAADRTFSVADAQCAGIDSVFFLPFKYQLRVVSIQYRILGEKLLRV